MPTFPHWKKLDPLWNLGKCTYFLGGGGVQARRLENSLDNVFLFFLVVLNLF